MAQTAINFDSITNLVSGKTSESEIKGYIEKGFSMDFIVKQLNGKYCQANFGSISHVWEYEKNGVKKKGIKCSSYAGGVTGTSTISTDYYDEEGNLVKSEAAGSKKAIDTRLPSSISHGTNGAIGLSEFISMYWPVIVGAIFLVTVIVIIIKRKRRK